MRGGGYNGENRKVGDGADTWWLILSRRPGLTRHLKASPGSFVPVSARSRHVDQNLNLTYSGTWIQQKMDRNTRQRFPVNQAIKRQLGIASLNRRYPSKHETLSQRCLDDGAASTTLDHHQNNVGSTSCVYRCGWTAWLAQGDQTFKRR